MSIYSQYDEIGKKNITATKNDFIETTTEDGLKGIIESVLLGGNVRDTTEYITKKRLINSNISLLDLFINCNDICLENLSVAEFLDEVCRNLSNSSNSNERLLNLWLLGLTKKGLDNIVRTEINIQDYKIKYHESIMESIELLNKHFGEISGEITINNNKIKITCELLVLLFSAIGSQTLSIRGSAKSMNGKLFEKLVLGVVLSILDFKFYKSQPANINIGEKIFWLSKLDEHEREVDATVLYNGQAISIDIGFIGKGNPEISLDKVSRFGTHKTFGSIKHDMSTIIIVDTVGENSDIFYKASKVNASIVQMISHTWLLDVAKLICEKFQIQHEILSIPVDKLPNYINKKINYINISEFIE